MIDLCYLIPQTNIGTLVVSAVTIVCLILAKELNAFLSKKLPVPIPVELLAVSITHALTHTRSHTNVVVRTLVYLLFASPGHYWYSRLLAGELGGEIWSGCGGTHSLRVRNV